MTLAGIIYYSFPRVAQSVLCKVQFVLFNIGLPIMMIGLAFTLIGYSLIVVVSIGATATSLAILIFTINILVGLKGISDSKDNME